MYAGHLPAFITHRVARIATSSVPLPDAWPPYPEDTEPDAQDWASSIRERLCGADGHVLLDLHPEGTEEADDNLLCWRAWALTTQLMRPIPQYASGELVFPVQVVEGRVASVSHYSTSDVHGQYHTDGTLLDQAPDAAILFGLEAAELGGETVLIDTVPLIASLKEGQPALARALMQDLPFLMHGQSGTERIKWQPALRAKGGRYIMTYLRLYIEQGFEDLGRPLPSDLHQALDAVDAWCAQPSHQLRVPLARGMYLAWDNARFLHGRMAFVQGRSTRRLRRIYAAYTR